MPRIPRPRRILAAALATVAVLGLVGAAAPAGATPVSYHEPYRPQFHFTPAQNWMNDPNGPIYYKGKYHLFFQYNPSGSEWGNISWGHAVSTDLVHWTELPIAIPQDDNEYVFSGSVVFDRTNSSGFGTMANPPLVAIYTSARKSDGIQAQSLAYSTDGGTTWTKYAGNPVLDLNSPNFRDPKVFWYAPAKRWEMVVALSDQHKVSLYSSPDLKSWTHQSDFGPAGAVGGVWECPNLFPLPVDGDKKHVKWVLVVGINPGGYAGGSGDQYFVGDFDGSTFTSDDPASYTPPAGTPLQGFDNGTYAPWTTTGTAFGNAPATGALPGQQAVTGFVGTGFADSFTGGDGPTGTLSSQPFTVSSPYLNFKVGGGDHPYVAGGLTAAPAGTTIEDFEGSSLPGWTGTGDFVGMAPAKESLPGELGAGVLDTCQAGCDAAQGTFTSPTFVIDAKYLDVLLAGGNHPLNGPTPTAVAVVVDGQVVASATGNNSGALNWQALDLSAYQGQQAQLEVVDEADGSVGWGHLIMDNPVLSDTRATGWADQTDVELLVKGQVVESVTGSNAEALDWASFDLRPYQGQQAQVHVVDQNTGGWGHINADQFTFADAPALSMLQRAHWVDYGADFYAATSFTDLPDGRQVLIGWMNNWNYAGNIPTSPWRSADSIPRELGLRTIDGRVQLTQRPVSSVDNLHTGRPVVTVLQKVSGTVPAKISGATLDLDVLLHPGTATTTGIDVHTGNGQLTRIGYDAAKHQVFIDRTKSGAVAFDPTFGGVQTAPFTARHGLVRLRVLVDTSSVEVFTDRGQVVLTDQVFPDAGSNGVDWFATGGTATVLGAVGWHVKSVWPAS